jgi:hypothetical protein
MFSPVISIFSLIAFYTNRLYTASDQNENKKKNGPAIWGAICAFDVHRRGGVRLDLRLSRNLLNGA